MLTRREALKTILAATAVTAGAGLRLEAQPAAAPGSAHELAPLPYAYDALEPYFDAKTMEIHHSRHHKAYVDNLNKAISERPGLEKMSLPQLFALLPSLPPELQTRLRNHGGGHYNHDLFWKTLRKNPGGRPRGELAQAIDKQFGGFDQFKERFTGAATSVFGSGWAWLSFRGSDRTLLVETSPNQDNPLMARAGSGAGLQLRIDGRERTQSGIAGFPGVATEPLLGIDVWEHAYYLKYQNRRLEYVAAFFDVIHWDYVSEQYAARLAGGREGGR